MRNGLFEFMLVAFPKLIGGFGTLTVNVVLLRYLGPESYGVYALCLAGITLTDAICGSAFDMGVLRLAPIYRVTDTPRSYGIEKSALILKSALGLILLVVLGVFSGPLSRIIFERKGESLTLLISAAAAVGLLALRSIQAHLQVDRKFVLYGALELLHSAIKFGGIGLVLVLFRPSPVKVLLFTALAPISTFLMAIRAIGGKLLKRFSRQREATWELLGFVKWALLTYSITSLVGRLDVILLSANAGVAEVGIYSGGQSFTMIVELFGSYLAVILGPRVVPYIRTGRFLVFFKKVQVGCFVLAVVIYLTWLLGRDMFQATVLPASFSRSSQVITVLLPGALAAMTFFPLVNSFLMFVRPMFIVTVECVTLPIVVLLYYYAIRTHGVLGAAWVNSGSRLVKLLIAAVMAWRWAHLSPEMAGLGGIEPDGHRQTASETTSYATPD